MLSEVSAKDFSRSGVFLVKEQINQKQTMKTRILLPTLLVVLSLVSALSQGVPIPHRDLSPPPGQPQPETPKLTTFSLDFPGGPPEQLVKEIEKATGKPLNVIIPHDYASFDLPPLKMNNVNIYQLFEALEATSRKTEKVVTGTYIGGGNSTSESYQFVKTSYGFRTPNPNGISDDSIWYFYVERPAMLPQALPGVSKVCRFYPLTSYLERGLTVDDITTAIQTGWKMLGDQEAPTISFHKETKLLIAVGEAGKLETIDAVLTALSPPPEEIARKQSEIIFQQNPGLRPAAGGSPPSPAKPAEKPKTEN